MTHFQRNLHLKSDIIQHLWDWYFEGQFKNWWLRSGGDNKAGLMPSQNTIESFNKLLKRARPRQRVGIGDLLASDLQITMNTLTERLESTPFASSGSKKICCVVDDLLEEGGAPFVSRDDLERAKEAYNQNDGEAATQAERIENKFFMSYPRGGPLKKKILYCNVDIPKNFDKDEEGEQAARGRRLRPRLPTVTDERIRMYEAGLDGAGEDEPSVRDYAFKYMSLHHVFWDEDRLVRRTDIPSLPFLLV